MKKSKDKYVEDVFYPLKYDGVTYGNYEITTDGVVRSAKDHSYKNTVQDSKGRNIVVIYRDKSESVSAYISEILKCTFNDDIEKEYIEFHDECSFGEDHRKYEVNHNSRYIENMSIPVPDSSANSDTSDKRSKGIKCNETGECYKSFSAAAKKFGVSYDKFYNSIYDHGMFIYNGEVLTFTKLS